MTTEKDLEYAEAMGSLIGQAVCAVIDYVTTNSVNNASKVEQTFMALAAKSIETEG